MSTGLFSRNRFPRYASSSACPTCDERVNAAEASFTIWKVKPHESCFPVAWEKVGKAWQHADGKGFTVINTESPHDGVYLMRLEPEKRLRDEMHRR